MRAGEGEGGSLDGRLSTGEVRPLEHVDQNGCDTRNDILALDLPHIRFKAGSDCVIVSGTLDDPYTARKISFVPVSVRESRLSPTLRLGAQMDLHERGG
jgi:hypothetical protein